MKFKRRVFSRMVLSACAVAGFGLLVGTAHAADSKKIAVEHAQGMTQVADNPQRVVVFDLATLDNLNAMGVDVTGVPGGIKPARLEKYNADKYKKVGTLFEPDYEAVAGLQPDLIIVGGRSAAKYKDLARIAPTIDLSFHNASIVDDVKKNVQLLGKLFHKDGKAAELIAGLDESIRQVQMLTAQKGNGLLILTTGGRMSAYGPGSRFGMLHDRFGVPAVDKSLKVALHGQPVSFEYILEKNPDWLFVIDRDATIGRKGTPAAQFLDNEIVNKTNAWKNQRVVYLDGGNWYLLNGSLVAIQENADLVRKALSGR
jgi:iron complex transport system substrate-binding protein